MMHGQKNIKSMIMLGIVFWMCRNFSCFNFKSYSCWVVCRRYPNYV